MTKPGPPLVAAAGSLPEDPERVQPPTTDALPPVGTDPDAPTPTPEIEKALGQTISSALDFANWEQGSGLQGLHKAQEYLTRSVREQGRILQGIRNSARPR
jgi:hypothetical protein